MTQLEVVGEENECEYYYYHYIINNNKSLNKALTKYNKEHLNCCVGIQTD